MKNVYGQNPTNKTSLDKNAQQKIFADNQEQNSHAVT